MVRGDMMTKLLVCPDCSPSGIVNGSRCKTCNGFGGWPFIEWKDSPVDEKTGKKLATVLLEVGRLAMLPEARIELAIALLRDETAEVRATIDELLAQLIEPDGAEPITPDWVYENGLGPTNPNIMRPPNLGIVAEIPPGGCLIENRTSGAWEAHFRGEMRPIKVKTRRDARDLFRIKAREYAIDEAADRRAAEVMANPPPAARRFACPRCSGVGRMISLSGGHEPFCSMCGGSGSVWRSGPAPEALRRPCRICGAPLGAGDNRSAAVCSWCYSREISNAASRAMVAVPDPSRCITCRGSGRIDYEGRDPSDCPVCGGSGFNQGVRRQ